MAISTRTDTDQSTIRVVGKELTGRGKMTAAEDIRKASIKTHINPDKQVVSTRIVQRELGRRDVHQAIGVCGHFNGYTLVE